MIINNHERFIAHTLESILPQRVNFNCEIVVGEDCSTDRTRNVLMDFYAESGANTGMSITTQLGSLASLLLASLFVIETGEINGSAADCIIPTFPF